jgi:hypothetical protein
MAEGAHEIEPTSLIDTHFSRCLRTMEWETKQDYFSKRRIDEERKKEQRNRNRRKGEGERKREKGDRESISSTRIARRLMLFSFRAIVTKRHTSATRMRGEAGGAGAETYLIELENEISPHSFPQHGIEEATLFVPRAKSQYRLSE